MSKPLNWSIQGADSAVTLRLSDFFGRLPNTKSKTELTKSNKPRLIIKDPPSRFSYGNCAIIALAQLTGIGEEGIEVIASLIGIKRPTSGLTFNNINKVLSTITDHTNNLPYKYTSNKTKVTVLQLVTLYSDRKIVLMFDEHLCFIENGIIYDSFFTTYTFSRTVEEIKPTGWWM